MNYNELKIISKNLKSKFFFNYDLSKFNWFRTGGKADVFCIVYDETELEIILNNALNIPIFVIGAGSNILIRDKGFKGLIIKLGKSFNKLEVLDNCILAGASILDINLSKFALSNSMSNLEFYSGIPGTVGGAIKMNAGCYGSETKDFLKEVNVISKKGKKNKLYNNQINFEYRKSNIRDDEIIISALFETSNGKKEEINDKLKKIKKMRELSQPLQTKTGGSTFKNPKGYHAAKLIEGSDCKGLKIGDAVVSDKHVNFLINLKNASAKNIEDLGKMIQKKVKDRFNIELEWEIKIIGEK